jgi:hypothetical protein
MTRYLTCVSFSGGPVDESSRPLTMVAPDIGIAAAHFSPGNGATRRWADLNSNVFSTEIFDQRTVDGTDIQVVRTMEEVPPEIGWATVPPPDFHVSFPAFTFRVPSISMDRDAVGVVQDFDFIGSSVNDTWDIVAPVDAQRLAFYLEADDESGYPLFLLDYPPMIVGCFYASTFGYCIHKKIAQINAKAAELGSAHQLTIGSVPLLRQRYEIATAGGMFALETD